MQFQPPFCIKVFVGYTLDMKGNSGRKRRSKETARVSKKRAFALEAQFQTLYTTLNKKQREAVDAIQGPVMVIAGPGTGKTSILTLRIANILRLTDTTPDSILALTFTESGAYSMRRKLVEIIGGAAYRVGIYTFHGFANSIIERFSESFPKIVGGRSATVADQVRILEKIFARNRFTLIRPFGDIFYYVPKALHAIHALKRENISPEAFKSTLRRERKQLKKSPDRLHASGRFKGEVKAKFRDRERLIEKSLELSVVYQAYEEALAKDRLFDFEDMLLEAIRALREDKNLLLTLQEQYQYVLADEHQDANNAQNRILELLTSFDDTPNLFLVGDEKQAIYRFQGASLENFLYFKKLYPKAALINLEENYRSTQFILDAAHSLMEKGTVSNALPREILRPRLTGTSAGKPNNIRFLEFSRSESEIMFLVDEVRSRVSAGCRPGEIAVLFRDNADVAPLITAFERTAIPFSVLSDENILADEELRKFMVILRATATPTDERFAEMLHVDFLGVPPVKLYEVLGFCHSYRHSLFEVLRSPSLREKARIKDDEPLMRVFLDFDRWASVARNRPAGEAVEQISRESGFVRYLLGTRGSLRGLERLDTLFDHLKELSENKREFMLAEFLDILERLEKHHLRLKGKGARPEFFDSITLLTAHRAKGLEFDYVYVVGAVDGHWGGRRGRETFYMPMGQKGIEDEDTEDERRLFFVSLTRARKEVAITMSREAHGGKARLPSQFVEDINPRFLLREDTATLEKRLSTQTPLYLRPRVNTGPSVTLREYLQKVFLEQGLTVTSLNNFLSCPWEYFFKNLVRLPKLPEPHLSFGNAVHDALRRYFDVVREGKKAGEKELLRFFSESLEHSPLPLREFREYRDRGKIALSGYLKKWGGSFATDTLTEFKVTGVFVPLENGTELLLRGKLDKIERNSDGTVTVVDYKTGKPKSRAHILGETKSSEGNLKRQLDFYKLLLDHFEHGTYRMTTGVIDFVEPDAKGNYHREVFPVSSADVDAVTEEVKRVGKDIYELAFWNTRCDDRACEYCRLREAIR